MNYPIEHYLLLPLYDWGVVEWHLDAIRPYILRHQPTIGFNLAEAMLARHVTCAGWRANISCGRYRKAAPGGL